MINQVVVKKKDGTLIKGTTSDFMPKKDIFHVEVKTGIKKELHKLMVNDLKAIFFVKKLTGDKTEHDRSKEASKPKGIIAGKHVYVYFHDNEVIEGFTHSLHLDELGFFMIPIDIMDNNKRIFVVLSFVDKITVEGKTMQVTKKEKKLKTCLICRKAMEHSWKYCPFDGTEIV